MTMSELADRQIRNNRESRDCWDRFRAHRRHVTKLLGGTGATPSRLCVLGAGNCNDLDLATLLSVHAEVHLVDLDAAALDYGVACQGLQGHSLAHRYGGIDITAVLDHLARWGPSTPIAESDLRACMEAGLQRVRPGLPGPFDVVASTCLLTQLMNGVVGRLGNRHPQFPAALQAVRAGHLRLLTDLVAPGATGILITDVVSSDTYPGLGDLGDAVLPSVLSQLIRTRNFFHGVNPAALDLFFSTDPVVAPQISGLTVAPPWLWDFGPRVYLVFACTFQKSVRELSTSAK
jgi:hypothetical protein